MRSFFSLILSLFTFLTYYAQTTIVVEAGPISYTNIDNTIGFTPVVDDYSSIDISDCTSIQFSVDFDFSLPWLGVGMGPRMEAADQCGIGAMPCAGDPTDPVAGACSNCWDFMWVQFSIGGSEVEDELLGLDLSTPQNGTITSNIYCTDGETEASITISNQNWSGMETNTFENVVILCWEGVPTIDPFPPVCSANNISLDGDAGDPTIVDDWLWTSDMTASIDDDAAQNTFATGAEDGETFTLTATDENGCTGTAEETLSLMGGFDATLMGGGVICPNSCTDLSSHIEIGLTGGVEPYTATLEFNGIPVTLPAFDIDENTFQICHEDGGLFPSVDNGSDPIAITIPNFIWDFLGGSINIEITSIEDDSGCSGTINGGAISVTLGNSPSIEEPDILPLCLDLGTTIDLTQFDIAILDGQSLCEVIWLDNDDDVNSSINSPDDYDFDSNGNTVYAVVFCDPCYSDIIEVELDINIRPDIELNTNDIEICGMDYELPDFDEVVIIDGEVDPGYFLDEDLNFGPSFPGSFLTLTDETEIFVYDESAPNCGDIASFFVTPLLEPEINSPSGTLTACGVIELPIPEIFNEDDWEYNTQDDGSGQSFFDGDEIFETDGIDMLFLIATTNEGCIDTTHIQLSFLGGTRYTAEVTPFTCDSLFLSAISPTPTTSSLGFYTSVGTGTVPDFNGGDTITAQSLPTLGTDTLYLYDPLAVGGCSTIDTFIFEIGRTPQVLNPGNQTFCESGTIEGLIIGVGPSDSILIQTDNGTELQEDTPITESTRIAVSIRYVFANDSLSCFQIFFFNVNIIDQPFAGDNASISVCQGYTQPLDFLSLLNNADPGGLFTPATIPDLDLSDPTQVDVGALPTGTIDLTYAFSEPGCPPDDAILTIDIIAPADPGTAADFSTCDPDTPINFVTLFGDPAAQGNWTATDIDDPALTIPIIDPTSVILSDLPGSGNGYTISHSVLNPNADFCEPNESSVFVTILDQLIAGDDATSGFCKGTVINLNDLLSSNASLGGTFESEDNLIFIGDTWDTGPTPLGLGPDFNLSYIVNSPGCDADTAFFVVTIADQLFAGTAAPDNSVCEGDQVNLSMFLEGETPGGDFFNSTNLTTPISDTWLATNTSQFTYIIPGIPGCDPDSTDFFVQVFPALTANAVLTTNMICEGQCTELIISTSESGGANLLVNGDATLNESELLTLPLVAGDNMLTLCQDDTAFGYDGTIFNIGNSAEVSVTINDIQSDLIDCQDVTLGQTEIIAINRGFELIVDTTICEGTSIEVEGLIFTSSLIINELTAAGCDSILNVNIDFYPPSMKNEDITLCDGESYSINGDVITSAVVDSMIILEGESARGCDSIVILNLQFDNVVEINFNDRLCADQAQIINGTVYDINSTFPETIMLPGINGDCDTSLVINLSFSQPLAFEDFTRISCDDTDYLINGETYNFANPTGIELLTDINGCDSLEVTIDIQELLSTEEDFIRNICTDEDFDVAGEIFNGTTNNNGTVMTTNQAGCDSIINVQINLSSIVMDTFRRELCDDQDFVIGGETFNFANPQGVVTIPSLTGCDTIRDVFIRELIKPSSTFSRDLCEGSTETFDINGTEYGLARNSGVETIIGGAINGCDSTVTVSIGMLPATAGPDFIIVLCENDDSSVEYNGTDYSLINNTGEEIFVAANGCDSIEQVSVFGLPVDNQMVVMDFCQDTTLTIGNTTYGPGNLSGTEVLTNEFGCDSIIDIQLNFSIPSADFSNCIESDGSEISLTTLSGISLPAAISIDGAPPIEITSLPIDLGFYASGNIDYEITGINGCMLMSSVQVDSDPQAVVNIVSTPSALNTFMLSLETDIAFNQVTWTPENLVDCVACDETRITISNDIEVAVTITTDEGCSYMDNILLTATSTPDSTIRVFLPTALSLGNEANNSFYPQSAEDFLVDALTVYDRWGNRVFHNEDFMSNSAVDGWNPDLDYRVEQGVYIYMLQYTDPELGDIVETNDLTVVR